MVHLLCTLGGVIKKLEGIAAAEVTLSLAFIAGFLSLISPCVLALVPAYLTYMTGVAMTPTGAGSNDRKEVLSRVLVHAIGFILGFTIIFVILGASATLIGRMFLVNQRLIGKIAGIVVAGFGLHMIGLLNIPGISSEQRLTYKGPTGKPYHSVLIGMAFAAGWTPCIGPILGGILAIASVQTTVWSGISLLLIYALGMGLPFLLIALTLEKSKRLTDALKEKYRTVEIVSGILLIIIGIMLYTDSFTLMARYLNYVNIL